MARLRPHHAAVNAARGHAADRARDACRLRECSRAADGTQGARRGAIVSRRWAIRAWASSAACW